MGSDGSVAVDDAFVEGSAFVSSGGDVSEQPTKGSVTTSAATQAAVRVGRFMTVVALPAQPRRSRGGRGQPSRR